jgi:hypothetical protein
MSSTSELIMLTVTENYFDARSIFDVSDQEPQDILRPTGEIVVERNRLHQVL